MSFLSLNSFIEAPYSGDHGQGIQEDMRKEQGPIEPARIAAFQVPTQIAQFYIVISSTTKFSSRTNLLQSNPKPAE